MARQPAARPPRRRKQNVPEPFRFERRNLYIFAAALGVITLGYILLGTGSITLSPILLVLGYCILLPLSLVWRPRGPGEDPAGTRPRETMPRP